MGQVYNVLIILAITLLMAVVLSVVAYFIDFLPVAAGGKATIVSNLLDNNNINPVERN